MRHQEAFSRSKPWGWLLGPFLPRSFDDAPVTSIIDSEEVIRDEVEEVLGRYAICPPSYRLRLLMCPESEIGEDLQSGPEEWVIYVALTDRAGEIVAAMTALEKYLHRRLARYAIRVKAVYWRMLPA
jgi:hypothetical protein